jgi:hypothetical protein
VVCLPWASVTKIDGFFRILAVISSGWRLIWRSHSRTSLDSEIILFRSQIEVILSAGY